MSASSIYLKHEISIKDLNLRFSNKPNGDNRANLANKWFFVGIDMAPMDSLETGIAVIDRGRHLMRMDKIDDDHSLLRFLDNLAPAENMVVLLDLPKSLNISSKWRQQQIKMHPLHLLDKIPNSVQELVPTDRFAQRAKDFYDALAEQGILAFSFFSAHAKLRYGLNNPFRHRSPQGCRTMQALLRQRLGIKEMPTNLVPSSVLDAMIGSYAAWLLCKGKENEHFKLYQDDEERLYLDPLKRPRILRSR